MGLSKSVESKLDGHVNEFHEIKSIVVNTELKQIEVRIVSYKNKASKLAGKEYAFDKVYLMTGQSYEDAINDQLLKKKCTNFILAHEDFIGAVEPASV